ncbi:thioredoxin [Pedobacter sp. Leaf41]|jgi:thiol-disulfide isomerase/thioredoxin|uniref:TlpA family protein disulfide reductase n=1 Tax=Pedobacter sp. Leaf41 TaxID=1736218 RepID=UPI0007026B50|nr:TlpA disulfide reductase family protein [Pedobacter sp. Leaf41]KQN37980.1 thioredoxin [Pedobacter sp. Leaf41]RZL34384.1 MAG: TlpA family protein disulfide reductase [Pedobacter sp.]
MKFIKKNIVNGLFIALLLVIVFVPDAKALLIRGLMEIGLYSPSIAEFPKAAMDLSGIKFQDAKGNAIDLGNLKGKVIFLNFWATWCPPCRAEMPSINKLYQKFKDDKNVVFIFADADGDLEKSVKFMTNRKYEMPVFKVTSTIPDQIFSGALPTTVIFDKQGRLSFRHEGIANYADKKIVDFLNKLKVSD